MWILAKKENQQLTWMIQTLQQEKSTFSNSPKEVCSNRCDKVWWRGIWSWLWCYLVLCEKQSWLSGQRHIQLLNIYWLNCFIKPNFCICQGAPLRVRLHRSLRGKMWALHTITSTHSTRLAPESNWRGGGHTTCLFKTNVFLQQWHLFIVVSIVHLAQKKA